MDLRFSDLPPHKKVYLASDFHLGSPDPAGSLQREKKIVRWLSAIQPHAAGIILAGDIFDFWFEYKHAVPKGFVRLLGKLADMTDSGIKVVIFTGNHDLWMKGYFGREMNITVCNRPQSFRIGRHQVLVGHGDGLGPGNRGFKILKRVFTNRLAQWAFRWLHPDVGLWLGKSWSCESRKANARKPDAPRITDERILKYCHEVEDTSHHDFYVFGHSHQSRQLSIAPNATYFNLGAWITEAKYLEIDMENATLRNFEG